jgi:hypothetical protein
MLVFGPFRQARETEREWCQYFFWYAISHSSFFSDPTNHVCGPLFEGLRLQKKTGLILPQKSTLSRHHPFSRLGALSGTLAVERPSLLRSGSEAGAVVPAHLQNRWWDELVNPQLLDHPGEPRGLWSAGLGGIDCTLIGSFLEYQRNLYTY